LLVPTLLVYLLIRVDLKPEPYVFVFSLGLVACFIGDAILLSSTASLNSGIVAFAVAHLLFIGALVSQRKWPSPFMVPVYGLAGIIASIVAPPAIIVYSVALVLTATLASGFGLYGTLGGLYFICADALLLWTTSHPDRLGHIVEMQLYVAALLGLTKGLLRQRKRNLMSSSEDDEAIEADMKMLDQCFAPGTRKADRLALWGSYIGTPTAIVRRPKPAAPIAEPEARPVTNQLSFSVLPAEFLTWLSTTQDEAAVLERPSLHGVPYQQTKACQAITAYLWRKQGRPYDANVTREDMRAQGYLEEPLVTAHQTLRFSQFVGRDFCIVLALRNDILMHHWVVKS
jgi:uncharacterized membrane protein YhhN